jgi:hypothetical protein
VGKWPLVRGLGQNSSPSQARAEQAVLPAQCHKNSLDAFALIDIIKPLYMRSVQMV